MGKYGTFNTDHILGRPYHLTFEILDKPAAEGQSSLRIVPAAELYEHIKSDDVGSQGGYSTPQDGRAEDEVDEYEVVSLEGRVVMRTNRDTVDDPSRQKLTTDDIETLKREETASGKNVIAKILESHTALDKKTAFALAKYTLRKARKYMRRFTVLPLDVTLLAQWILHQKEPGRIMEIREEILALICSWSNVHCGGLARDEAGNPVDSNRWLVVDETGGLIVAAMAERMGILYPPPRTGAAQSISQPEADATTDCIQQSNGSAYLDAQSQQPQESPTAPHSSSTVPKPQRAPHPEETSMSATHNTITLLHANLQPNLSLLPYFAYHPANTHPSHPLHTRLKTLSWLHLLSPSTSPSYQPPTPLSPTSYDALSSNRKRTYHRKRRRTQRIATVADEARAGGFAGLIVASAMEPASVLRVTVPLLRGGARVVVYSPTVEPLAELADYYSSGRRSAFQRAEEERSGVGYEAEGAKSGHVDDGECGASREEEGRRTRRRKESLVPSDEFPVDPRLLLAPTIHTARARPWQVLPGRTHPKMTGRGGAEGYVFVATRVLPAEGKVAARGQFAKKRKVVPVVGDEKEEEEMREVEGAGEGMEDVDVDMDVVEDGRS